MKRLAGITGSLVLLFLTTASHADTTLPIVGNYSQAQNKKIWRLVRAKNVPSELIQTVKIADPRTAYQAPYPNVFLQNERVVVCYDSCEKPQNIEPERSGADFVVRAKGGTKMDVLRQANVYYWVNYLFDRLEEMGYKPSKRLVARVDREVDNPDSGADFTNNAFFNDGDWSLSLLPREGGLVYSLLGKRMGPSANDPSVVMHETMHSVFQELIGSIINKEVYGLHEAFADYFALVALESPDIGAVMMRGKPMRTTLDTSVRYEPDMEVHDLGNVVATVLQQIRRLFNDPRLADSIAFESIREFSLNPYASAGDITAAHLRVVERMASSEIARNPDFVAQVKALWRSYGIRPTETVLELSGLFGAKTDNYVSALLHTQVPAKTAKEFGLPEDQKTTLTLYNDVRPGPSSTSFWFLVSACKTIRCERMWVLFDSESKSIRGAATQGLEPILSTSPQLGQLADVSESMEKLIALSSFGQEAMKELQIFRSKIMKILFKTRLSSISGPDVTINGTSLKTTGHELDIKSRLLPIPPKRKFIFTAKDPSLSELKLAPGPDDGKVVGYGTANITGITETLLLQEVR